MGPHLAVPLLTLEPMPGADAWESGGVGLLVGCGHCPGMQSQLLERQSRGVLRSQGLMLLVTISSPVRVLVRSVLPIGCLERKSV